MSAADELMRMKKRVEDAKENLTRAQANHEAALERLKELGYDNVADAEKALGKLEKQISDAQDAIEDGLRQLEQDYPEL